MPGVGPGQRRAFWRGTGATRSYAQALFAPSMASTARTHPLTRAEPPPALQWKSSGGLPLPVETPSATSAGGRASGDENGRPSPFAPEADSLASGASTHDGRHLAGDGGGLAAYSDDVV